MDYGVVRSVDLSVADAIVRVTGELAHEGFSVIPTSDVKATLKQKLNKDVRPYLILDAVRMLSIVGCSQLTPMAQDATARLRAAVERV